MVSLISCKKKLNVNFLALGAFRMPKRRRNSGKSKHSSVVDTTKDRDPQSDSCQEDVSGRWQYALIYVPSSALGYGLL